MLAREAGNAAELTEARSLEYMEFQRTAIDTFNGLLCDLGAATIPLSPGVVAGSEDGGELESERPEDAPPLRESIAEDEDERVESSVADMRGSAILGAPYGAVSPGGAVAFGTTVLGGRDGVQQATSDACHGGCTYNKLPGQSGKGTRVQTWACSARYKEITAIQAAGGGGPFADLFCSEDTVTTEGVPTKCLGIIQVSARGIPVAPTPPLPSPPLTPSTPLTPHPFRTVAKSRPERLCRWSSRQCEATRGRQEE